MSNLCENGCGRVATHTYKNGRSVCNRIPAKCPVVNDKAVEKLKGVADAARLKREKTNLERFGCASMFKSDQFKKKAKQTLLEKYGVDNYSKTHEYLVKREDTWLTKYGVKHPMNNTVVKEKFLDTCNERYGVNYPYQNKDIQQRYKDTMIDRYGVENPLQNDILHSKQQRSAFKFKEFIMPSGRVVFLRGYEPYALRDLLELYDESDILIGDEISPIKYYHNRNRTYFPDFFIKSKNLIIEVKSEWTFNKELEKNEVKKAACISQGYSFEFYVMSPKGQKLV